tara:strand:+ start:316 stop:474 length:159 start_codon:yes stop_codon:yes gene_type:complete
MKQLESQLNCKATASLESQVEEDLQKKDKSIAELLEEDNNGQTTKDDKQADQ